MRRIEAAGLGKSALFALTLMIAPPAWSAGRTRIPDGAARDPTRFVRWVYGQYTPNSDFVSSITYSAGLKALFARNARLVGPDVIGENDDDDPICQCQDWERVSIQSLKIWRLEPDRAKAIVTFDWGTGDERPATGILTLVRTPSGWRVDDVRRSGDRFGLKAHLRDENRRLAQEDHRAHHP